MVISFCADRSGQTMQTQIRLLLWDSICIFFSLKCKTGEYSIVTLLIKTWRVAAEVTASKVLRDLVVVNSSGSWFHSLIFDGENNISYLRQSYVFTAPTYADWQG